MGFVGQFLFESVKLDRTATRNTVLRVIRQNKDIAQAIKTLEKSRGRQEAVLEVIKRNPSVGMALTHELAKLRQKK